MLFLSSFMVFLEVLVEVILQSVIGDVIMHMGYYIRWLYAMATSKEKVSFEVYRKKFKRRRGSEFLNFVLGVGVIVGVVIGLTSIFKFFV
jgi:sorbitol-specific phosphotransferase system component IIBC